MSYNPNNPNGSATSANSGPVVIASDQAAVQQGVQNGATTEPNRHPNIYKSVSGTTGTLTVWTPASGKKFRLLRYAIEVTAAAALSAGAGFAITLQDNATSVGLVHSLWLPTTSVTTNGGVCYSTGWVDLGGIGILSAAANNPFTLLLSATLTAGSVRVRTAGTEE